MKIDAAIRSGCDAERCNYPACLSSLAGMECRTHKRQSTKTLRAALHLTPPEDVIEAAIEAASEYVSSTWRGSKAWDTKEYAIAQVAAQAAYHILRAQILGEDV